MLQPCSTDMGNEFLFTNTHNVLEVKFSKTKITYLTFVYQKKSHYAKASQKAFKIRKHSGAQVEILEVKIERA